MKVQSHKKSLGSNFDRVTLAMNILPDKEKLKGWDTRRRIPASIKPRILEERQQKENYLEDIKFGANHKQLPPEEKFKFLTVKKHDEFFSPIGFKEYFTNFIDAIRFAQSQGRQFVRLLDCENGIYNVEKTLEKDAEFHAKKNEQKEFYIKFGYWKQGD